jgi:STE24 endopeptidase
VGLRPPRRLRRLLDRGGARPVLVAAATGAGTSVVMLVVSLPFSALMERRSRAYGLSTQNWRSWSGDLAKSTAIGAVFAAFGAAIFIALLRRFPRSWWALAAAGMVVLSATFGLLAPVLLDPLFNKFTPLPEGAARSDVLALAREAEVQVGEVYRVDASRRTTGANAYVGGLGATKRVVLYDTLLNDFAPDQVRSIVAHELGHVKHRDVPRALLWLALVAPAATLAIQRLTERLAPESRGRGAGPAALLPAAFSSAIVSSVIGPASNVLSRGVERRADSYALALTKDPAALIEVQRKLAVQNVADPDPPAWIKLLFGSHPSTVQRIGAALAWAHEH